MASVGFGGRPFAPLPRVMRMGAGLRVAVGMAMALCGCSLQQHHSLSEESLALPVASAPAPVSSSLACIQHPTIDAWERRLHTRAWRADMRQTLERGEAYLPQLRRIMQENGVPPSLALLPAVESSFYVDARGRTHDRGLWQLQGPTARRFGLVVNKQRDDRLHPDHSTRAAARYLRLLHKRYRDWPTALAAYNAGERRIDRARARQPGANFWELASSGQLPARSRDYVSRFLAVVRMSEGVQTCGHAVAPPVSERADRPSRRPVLALLD
jgi:Transglycosylase SLT domain